MPIQLASQIIPRNANNPDPSLVNTWYLLEDVYLKGGFQVWPTTAARDAINPSNLKAGMLVYTQDVSTIWQLGEDLLTWTALDLSGNSGSGTPSRQVVIQDCGILAVGATSQFTLQIGPTAMILALSVTYPALVQAFSTPAMVDTNPYAFLATADHLSDDGSMVLSDGSIINLRRYSVFSNFETPLTNNIYFTVTNQGTAATDIALTITYLPIEGLN